MINLQLRKRLLKIFFPQVCPKCNKLIPFNDFFCLDCECENYRFTEGICPVCKKEECICEAQISAAFTYAGIIRMCIHRMKFKKERNYAKFFADEMAADIITRFDIDDFDAITFVPMSNSSKRKRGFNQSELLARNISKRIFVPEMDLLVKSKNNTKQSTLNARQRAENVKGVFALKDDVSVRNMNILLCDDIRTTGSTLNACRKVLLEAGADSVTYAVIAVTPLEIKYDI